MHRNILAKLAEIQTTESVRILYACESGSRAWGFASQDSDYDVRFIYVRHPEWHFSIEPGRDVIECPIVNEIDCNGWDLRKALRLLRKSNPPLLECLNSPIVYRKIPVVVEDLRRLVAISFRPASSAYHYLRIVQRNFRTYLHEDPVWLKNIFMCCARCWPCNG